MCFNRFYLDSAYKHCIIVKTKKKTKTRTNRNKFVIASVWNIKILFKSYPQEKTIKSGYRS